ncbi:hypothetical protein Syun_006056 [Stephania yunnanensis]|uniref:Biotin carboxyl carrier protein of acetyl-CoA carboxylase n=1 Tax=Stephania yunnanensis TaxID=152371 RepID=A0AAP0PY78_9MAGN
MATSIPSASAAAASVNKNGKSVNPQRQRHSSDALSWRLSSKFNSNLRLSTEGLLFYRSLSSLANAQLSESKGPISEEKDLKPAGDSKPVLEPSPPALGSEASFIMSQVSSLVKLVDSRDIMELQVKNLDFELVIRKKEALPQPPAPAPVVMMHPPAAPAAALPISSPAPAPTPIATPSLPAAKPAKSSHPPLKSPMAGTFYRSPGPGQPAFVKVGDKVQKGQPLCIIEAMKLMNEIEADQSGKIVEILLEDGKPVSVDTPLFVIEP